VCCLSTRCILLCATLKMRNKHSSNKNGELLNNLHFELIFFYFVVSRLESSTIPAEVIMNEEKTCSSWVSTRMRDKLSAIDDLLVRELVNFDVNPSVYIKNCWCDFLKHSCGINRKHQFEKLRFEEVWGSGRKYHRFEVEFGNGRLSWNLGSRSWKLMCGSFEGFEWI